MSRPVKKGSTDQSVVIRIVDSADGTPETGVVAATSGLDLRYRREGEADAALTESDLAALTTAHADGGMKHIGAGYYRVDGPDAAFATGANGVLFFGTCTGMVVIGCYVPLVDYDPQNATTLGLTNLDAAVSSRLATAGYTAPPSAAAVADAVWDEPTSGHTTADTFGEQAKTDIDAILADTGTDGVVVASGSKSGYSLAAAGLDSISVADPAGVAGMTTLPKMLVGLWRRAFKKTTLDSSGNFKTYGDDGSTVRTTEVITDASGTQTKGAAS